MPRRLQLLVFVLLAGALVPLRATSQALTESFDDTSLAWQLHSDSRAAKLVSQDRTQAARDGNQVAVEALRFTCPAGESALFEFSLEPLQVIAELQLELDVEATNPGVQLAVEVVLPRSINPQTNAPWRLVVRGEDRLDAAEQWATLKITNTPVLVKRQLRALRAQRETSSLDEREAYIDRVVVIVPGGPEGAEVKFDELRLTGRVLRDDTPAPDVSAGPRTPESPAEKPSTDLAIVTLNSEGFRIGERRLFPRAWLYHDEPLDELAQRGFNVLWLNKSPSRKLLVHAAQNHLALVCPAPPDAVLTDRAAAAVWAPVIAWRLLADDEAATVDTLQVELERLRGQDRHLRRPMLVETADEWPLWSRLADGVVVRKTFSAVSPREPQLARHWRQVQRGLRPDAPLFAWISTAPDRLCRRQISLLDSSGRSPASVPSAAIQAELTAAISSGCRGVIFAGSERLTSSGEEARALAASLELANLKLTLFEPWLVGGRALRAVESNRAVTLFERPQAKLILLPSGQQPNREAWILPGVTSASQAYRMNLAGMEEILAERVTGGLRLPPLPSHNAMLLADNSQAPQSVGKFLQRVAPRVCQLQAELAAATMREATAGGVAAEVLQQATRLFERSKLALAPDDYFQAYDLAADGQLLLEAAQAQPPYKIAPALVSSPLGALPSTRRQEAFFAQLLASLTRGANQLYGGSFEDLAELRQFGWRQKSESAGATVELAVGPNKHGARRLLMHSDLGSSARIDSPPVELAAGDLIEISGWLKVSSEDGALEVRDSLGGQALGLVVSSTPQNNVTQWAPFYLYRRADQATQVAITFAVEGVCTAEIDGVMLRKLSVPASVRAAQVPRP